MWLFLFFLLSFPISFLTWKRDPQHCINVVWLTEDCNYTGLIQWKTEDEENFHQKAALKTKVTLDKRTFYLFQTQLNFLKPDQVYLYKIEDEVATRKFKTAPSNLEEKVKFIVGGDAYHDNVDHVSNMFRAAAKFNPLFCVLGGDLAYAFTSKKSEVEELDRWFTFLSTYEKEMVTPDGNTIPLLPILGNHDIKSGYLAGVRNAKFFFTVFPFPGNTGYNRLDFGKWLSLFLLDSGHANPVGGTQTTWLQKGLEEKKGVDFLFAIYHVGAYPSVRSFIGKRSQEIRKHWSPLFDLYNLTAAFEHHDHALKRTVPDPREQPQRRWGDLFGRWEPRRWNTSNPLHSRPTLVFSPLLFHSSGMGNHPKSRQVPPSKQSGVDGKIIDQTSKLSRKK